MYNKRLFFRLARTPNSVAMNKYYYAGKTGSDFFEKAREVFNQLQRPVFRPVLNKIR